MRRDRGVGAESNLYAGAVSEVQSLSPDGESLLRLGLHRGGELARADDALDAGEGHQGRRIISAMRFHCACPGFVEEGAVFDRIDACVGRGENALRAMRVRRDLEVHCVRHVADRLHLLIGEMLLETHGSRIEHAARRHELDHIHSGGGQLANNLLAFLDAGADGGVEVGLIDRGRELWRESSGRIGMASDDRQRRAGNLDAGAREAAFGDRVAHRGNDAGVAAEVADRREAAAHDFQRMCEAHGRRIRIGVFLGIISIPRQAAVLR